MRALTFRERMREEAARLAAVENTDPWRLTLERVRGKIDFFDRLAATSAARHCWIFLRSHNATGPRARFGGWQRSWLKSGWTAVRVRDLTRGGYREQIRGYCRQPRNMQAGH